MAAGLLPPAHEPTLTRPSGHPLPSDGRGAGEKGHGQCQLRSSEIDPNALLMTVTPRFTVPLPGNVPLRWVIAAAAVLLLGQLWTGTSPVYAQLVFLFVVLSGVALNLAGGPCRLGGFCIAMMSLK